MQRALTNYISIHAERCLNSRASADSCRLCADACPLYAIDLVDGGIRFDGSLCNECALCVSDCPTEGFIHSQFAQLDLVERAKGSKELGLICRFSEAKRVIAGSLSIPCHGLLDDRLLAGLRAAGVEELYLYGLNRCDGCLSRVGGQRLAKTLAKATQSLAARFPDMHDATDAPADLMMERSEETESNRRQFLGSMATEIAFVAISTLPDSLQADHASVVGFMQNECNIKHLPQSHRLALSNLRLTDISIGMVSWFHQLRAVGTCDACGLCSLTCPTGALFDGDSEDTFKLSHKPAVCIGCNLCADICPHQALRLHPATEHESISSERAVLLYEYDQSVCEACGCRFIQNGGKEKLCSSCGNERLIEDMWLGNQAG